MNNLQEINAILGELGEPSTTADELERAGIEPWAEAESANHDPDFEVWL